MDGLARQVGNGIGGVFGHAIDAIGQALGGAVSAAERAIPFGLIPLVALGVAVVGGWLILRR